MDVLFIAIFCKKKHAEFFFFAEKAERWGTVTLVRHSVYQLIFLNFMALLIFIPKNKHAEGT